MNMNTIGDTIERCDPRIEEGLIRLFDVCGTLENILLYPKARECYAQLMLYVIMERERELGHIKYNFETWKDDYRSFEDIYKDYSRTVVMPC